MFEGYYDIIFFFHFCGVLKIFKSFFFVLLFAGVVEGVKEISNGDSERGGEPSKMSTVSALPPVPSFTSIYYTILFRNFHSEN